MPTFRVEKNRNYTVMSNYHLKDNNISLKAKGLLSQMLSLPEDWSYTLSGLSHINKESIDAIRSAVRELEKYGYITRHQTRGKDGKMGKVEYTIYEQPQLNDEVCDDIPEQQDDAELISDIEPEPGPQPQQQSQSEPILENSTSVESSSPKPILENPTSVTTTQLNTNRLKTNKSNRDKSSIYPINQSITSEKTDRMDEMADTDSCRNMIMDNLEYDILVEQWGAERLDEVVELILETILTRQEFIHIAGGDYPAEVVKSRLLKINAGHVEYVFACMNHNTTKVRNIKAYLLAALFNAPATMDSFYRAEYNHDMFCD